MDILRITDGGKSVKFTLNSSHHPMAGKEPPCLLVSGRIGQLRVNGSVLDVGMAQPVFDKGEVGAGV